MIEKEKNGRIKMQIRIADYTFFDKLIFQIFDHISGHI